MTRQQAKYAAKILTAYAEGLPLQIEINDVFVDIPDSYEFFRKNYNYSKLRIVENKWILGDKPDKPGMYYVSRYNIMYKSRPFLARCRYENGEWKTWAKDSKIIAFMPYTELFKPKPILIK